MESVRLLEIFVADLSEMNTRNISATFVVTENVFVVFNTGSSPLVAVREVRQCIVTGDSFALRQRTYQCPFPRKKKQARG